MRVGGAPARPPPPADTVRCMRSSVTPWVPHPHLVRVRVRVRVRVGVRARVRVGARVRVRVRVRGRGRGRRAARTTRGLGGRMLEALGAERVRLARGGVGHGEDLCRGDNQVTRGDVGH